MQLFKGGLERRDAGRQGCGVLGLGADTRDLGMRAFEHLPVVEPYVAEGVQILGSLGAIAQAPGELLELVSADWQSHDWTIWPSTDNSRRSFSRWRAGLRSAVC